jgi:hypothetical protein
MKAPNPKIQIPGKLQVPSFKLLFVLALSDWNLLGAWNLGFGASKWFTI